MNSARRVVITGIGALTPIGSGVDAFWTGVWRGESAVRKVTRFDASAFRPQLAAEIDDFDPCAYLAPRRARRLDRFSEFAVASSLLALDDATLKPRSTALVNAGCYIGSALGGVAFGEAQHQTFLRDGPRHVSPTLALSVFGGAGPTNAIPKNARMPIVTASMRISAA